MGEFVGNTGDNAPHSHHAVWVLLSARLQPLWTAASACQNVRSALIGFGLSHQLGSNGRPIGLLYVEPRSDAGHRLMTGLSGGLRVLTPPDCEAAHLAVQTGDARRHRI